VYSTCTISPLENERLVDAFLRDRPEFEPEPVATSGGPVWDHPTVPRYSQTLPHRDGTDGFFVARLRRAS
jgi:16S rRNA (cytosine967-C5)-methyltransferase